LAKPDTNPTERTTRKEYHFRLPERDVTERQPSVLHPNIHPAAQRELGKLDPQTARRILVVRIGNRKQVYRK